MGQGPIATAVAEEILRRICGHDLHGCKVSLEEIAAFVEGGLTRTGQHRGELIEMYDKAMEAVNLPATPLQTRRMAFDAQRAVGRHPKTPAQGDGDYGAIAAHIAAADVRRTQPL